jgi:transcriptional regulator with XRE-family HTH domain
MTLNPVVPIRARIPEWTFAERLRKGRRDAGLSQKDLAARLEVKESTYSAWETGRNTPDILELAPKLEMLTGVSRLFYIGWAESNNPEPPEGIEPSTYSLQANGFRSNRRHFGHARHFAPLSFIPVAA